MFEKVSIQRCTSSSTETKGNDRLGSKALYAFIYPNFMINRFMDPSFSLKYLWLLFMWLFLPDFNPIYNTDYRYGPWMDTNLIVPLGPRKCKVVFDYFLDSSLKVKLLFMEIICVPCAIYYRKQCL